MVKLSGQQEKKNNLELIKSKSQYREMHCNSEEPVFICDTTEHYKTDVNISSTNADYLAALS